MNKKMNIHYDSEGDFLEVRFGKSSDSYYEELSKDVFKRIDEKTGKLKGYAIFNVKKRNVIKDVEVPLTA